MGKNHNSMVALRIRSKFWWMLRMGVRDNHTKYEPDTQRWRPGTGVANVGPPFQNLRIRAKMGLFGPKIPLERATNGGMKENSGYSKEGLWGTVAPKGLRPPARGTRSPTQVAVGAHGSSAGDTSPHRREPNSWGDKEPCLGGGGQCSRRACRGWQFPNGPGPVLAKCSCHEDIASIVDHVEQMSKRHTPSGCYCWPQFTMPTSKQKRKFLVGTFATLQHCGK